MTNLERFLRYIRLDTKSSDTSGKTLPSTDTQFALGRLLVQELLDLGLKDARMDDKCYVYASLPATKGLEDRPSLGFIAHMDTSPDFNGTGVNPQIIPNYDGGDVALGDSGRVLSVADFAHLPTLKGRTLITTDGTTLLGADDKAGISEIITMVDRVIEQGIPHGKICVAFTPDEEIGSGADGFDVPAFGADYGYTCDGSVEGELQYENFNAAGARVIFNGFNVHPGESKDTMINAALVAMEFNNALPQGDIPRHTVNYQGFFHLCDMKGNVERAELNYIIRDHNEHTFAHRHEQMEHIAELLNAKYGNGTCELSFKEQYTNMKSMVEPHFHLIENAKAVMEELNIEPRIVPIRGGTDGARLSFMGLPCPNLGTGGFAFHGPYEHITVEGMEQCIQVLMGIVRRYAKKD